MHAFTTLLNRNPRLKEFESLLEQIEKPALIWNIKQNSLLACNAKTIEISGFSRKEIRNISRESFFPNLVIPDPLSSPLQIETILKTQSNSQLPVVIKIIRIIPESPLVLFLIEDEQDIQQKELEVNLQHQRWEALHALSLAPLRNTLIESFRQALQAGQLLTGCGQLAIYLPPPENPNRMELVQDWGNSEFFPPSINTSEISHLRIPYLWQPGIKSTSILHQKALVSQFTYLATCPIDQSNPLDGLLVVGDQIANPPGDLVRLLQIITGTLISCISQFEKINRYNEENKLNEQKNNISQIIQNSINDGLILVNQIHEIIDMNMPASLILGYSPTEAFGKPLNKIIVSDLPLPEGLTPISREEAILQDMGEIKIRRRDGQSVLVNLRIISLPGNIHNANYAILISDLSAREEYRSRTKQLENHAILGEVMAIFAHEVRNPINNISMGLELLGSNFPEENPIQSDIERLRSDIDRLEDLMKSVLSVARSREYKMELVNVQSIIESLIYRWKPRMERFKVNPSIQALKEVPSIRGDKRSLEQVFTNLFQNAINAMKENGGTLSIRISASNPTDSTSKLIIDVSDTGLGIPDEILERIFDPFFTTNQDGTGLGLAITKQIINAHNGQIDVTSVPGGTVFRIQLPVITLDQKNIYKKDER